MSKSTLNAYAHCVFRIYYHIVFLTKFRHKALSEDILRRLKEHFARLCSNVGCDLVEFNGEAYHVHLLVDANPNVALSKLVNTLKTICSREIRKEFAEYLKPFYWKPFLWSRAYCIVSAGGAPLNVLKQHIENQGKEPS